MKKEYLIVALLAISQTIMAQNYFAPGMIWEERTDIINEAGFPEDILLKYYLADWEEIDGRQAAPLYCERAGTETALICYISTDGNKVFSLCGKTDKEWELLYDFDIAVGETAYVWSTPNVSCNNFGSGPIGVNCLEQEIVSTTCGPIEMIKVDDSLYPDPRIKKYWIKGIGSDHGVTLNCNYNADGIGGRLLKATFNGKTVYEDPNLSQIKNPNACSEKLEFYNLQGVRVETPKRGEILIEVSQSGCRKRIF